LCGRLQANRAALAELKAFQEKVRLDDEIAQEAIKEAARANVEDVLEKGIEVIKRRTRVRDNSDAVKVCHLGLCLRTIDASTRQQKFGPVHTMWVLPMDLWVSGFYLHFQCFVDVE
jgi:hypothetical protein